jgi:hypothetical protein
MMNASQDFAERIKKFYYSRALLCEKLIDRKVIVGGHCIMPPLEYNPLNNFYVDAYIIGCAAIDGLASMWESLSQSQCQGNGARFTALLIHLDTCDQMNRICTPFLVFFLRKQGIEEPLAQEIEAKWLNNRHERDESHIAYGDRVRESHRVYDDPTLSDLISVYEDCHQRHPLCKFLSLKNPDAEFKKFTYASLIYKFYRCSFVHEFRSSQFATSFNTGNDISIREFSFSTSPSGVETKLADAKPQLDIGIGVLTDSIRRGADIVHDLIIKQDLSDIPYGSNDEVQFKVRSTEAANKTSNEPRCLKCGSESKFGIYHEIQKNLD